MAFAMAPTPVPTYGNLTKMAMLNSIINTTVTRHHSPHVVTQHTTGDARLPFRSHIVVHSAAHDR